MVEPQWGPVAKHPEASRPRSGRQGWGRRVLAILAIVVGLGLVSGVAVVAVGYTTTRLPDANAEFDTAVSSVYYNDGKAQLGSFAIQNRQPLTFDEMPDTMKQAVVAAENRTFWTDRGISIRGMVRAAWAIARGRSIQGGSTITQQYIKIKYLYSEQTATRKFKELFLAYKINRQLSKEQILEGYLNTIYFGHGAYGIQAASKAYFDVDAEDLTVPQAAVLASVINNPTYFDPDDDEGRENLLGRYRYVLQSMVETGDLTPEQGAKYSRKLPKFPDVRTSERYGGPKGFLLKMVERELSRKGFSSDQIRGGGLKITTTFDKAAQKAAVEAAQDHTETAARAAGKKAANLHAAIASVEVGTGEVLALYGGPNYVKNSRNWATTARPTASTFKAFALAAGLEDGYSLRSTFRGNTFTPEGDTTPIRNEYSYQYGYAVDLIKATTDSINTAFVDMTTKMQDGPRKILDLAAAAGAPKGDGWDPEYDRIALGAAEVSPLNQASAYATFANDGTAVADHVVREVQNANGEVLYKATPTEKRAMSEDISHDVTYALSNVVENGTGSTVRTLNRPVAGKTGTNGVTDAKGEDIVNSAWFVGYTEQISTAVMYVAGDSGTASLDDYRRPGDSTFFGGTYPAQTWEAYMATATADQPVKQFEDPAYVNADTAPQQQTYQPTQPSAPATSRAPQSASPEPEQEPEPEPSDEGSTSQQPSESSTPRAAPSRTPTAGASTEGGNGSTSEESGAGQRSSNGNAERRNGTRDNSNARNGNAQNGDSQNGNAQNGNRENSNSQDGDEDDGGGG